MPAVSKHDLFPMLIVADENMPNVREWFGPFGEVRTSPGRALTAAVLREADALLVRSVTKVDRQLIGGSRVRFIGTATSGTEHLDTEYLKAQNIAYASAPGCNATAVVEYVLSCLCAFDDVLEQLLAGGTVGIIGLGNVGARLAQRLLALGINCIGFDPFIAANSNLPLCDLDTVLNADVICCHTPLTRAGAHPTWHLLDERRLQRLRENTVLINAGRGAVIDNAALLQILQQRSDLRVALDVWDNEPDINLQLLEKIQIATPHIAGYSWDGKVAGTRAVLAEFCRFFQLSLPSIAVEHSEQKLQIAQNLQDAALLKAALQSIYDVRRDDKTMRGVLLAYQRESVAENFDRLRKQYPIRREVAAYTIENAAQLSAEQKEWLTRLGFKIWKR